MRKRGDRNNRQAMSFLEIENETSAVKTIWRLLKIDTFSLVVWNRFLEAKSNHSWAESRERTSKGGYPCWALALFLKDDLCLSFSMSSELSDCILEPFCESIIQSYLRKVRLSAAWSLHLLIYCYSQSLIDLYHFWSLNISDFLLSLLFLSFPFPFLHLFSSQVWIYLCFLIVLFEPSHISTVQPSSSWSIDGMTQIVLSIFICLYVWPTEFCSPSSCSSSRWMEHNEK